MHAAPGNLWEAPMPDAEDDALRSTYGGLEAGLVVYGHIHRPFVRIMRGLTVANSGSVGLPYDGDRRLSYLLIEEGVPAVRRVAYDLEREAHDLADSGHPLGAWLAEVQRKGRFSPPS
jgi:predicted phosphodiesterase